MEVAKAGSLLRLSSVLKQWKSCWFVLFANGELHFWETEDSFRRGERPQGKLIIRDEVKQILSGTECSADAPEACTKDCLLGLKRKGGDQTVYLCAESSDDMSAWVFMIDQFRGPEGDNSSNAAAARNQLATASPHAARNPNQPAGGYAQLVSDPSKLAAPYPSQQMASATPYPTQQGAAAAPYPTQQGAAVPYPIQQGTRAASYPVQQGAAAAASYPVQLGGPAYNYYPPTYNYVQPAYVYAQPTTTIVMNGGYSPYYYGYDPGLVGGLALGMAASSFVSPFWFF